MQVNFVKMHGLGNDFILVDCTHHDYNIEKLIDNAVKFCDRRFGIGGDGLILAMPSSKCDFRMRIINSDGSEPEMCGNGIRCFAKFLYDLGKVNSEKFTVETFAGVIIPELIIENGIVTDVKVDMGEPILDTKKIPVNISEDEAINYPLKVNDVLTLNITAVSMGNPHAVIFVDNVDDYPVEDIGSIIEINKVFPKKTNVEFAEIISDDYIKMRVWERGSGITLACGTGACATLVAANLNGLSNNKAIIELPGGPLIIEWDKESNHIYMTGAAATVFCGSFEV